MHDHSCARPGFLHGTAKTHARIALPGAPAGYVAAAALCVFLENIPFFDQLFQKPFFSHGAWLASKEFHLGYKTFLYTGPKIAIAIAGVAFFVLFARCAFLRRTKDISSAWEKPALLIVMSILLIPLFVAVLKPICGVHSPVDLLPYGGKHPHMGVLEHLWAYGRIDTGRSFPAGHASGGFALLSLSYLPLSPAAKKLCLFLGLGAGWLMGLYQMARGEHFISHTLASMFIAMAVITYTAATFAIPDR